MEKLIQVKRKFESYKKKGKIGITHNELHINTHDFFLLTFTIKSLKSIKKNAFQYLNFSTLSERVKEWIVKRVSNHEF